MHGLAPSCDGLLDRDTDRHLPGVLLPTAGPRPPGVPGPPWRQVWVRAAVTQGTEPRSALEVGEWALEPVLGNPQEMALSLTLADASCVTFVLQAHDMQDIAAALRRLQPRGW